MLRILEAKPGERYTLIVKLDNGKSGIFDVAPNIDKGVFQELKDKRYFDQVKVLGRSICWPHEQDFCADTIDELIKD
jgi:hypothetical protein